MESKEELVSDLRPGDHSDSLSGGEEGHSDGEVIFSSLQRVYRGVTFLLQDDIPDEMRRGSVQGHNGYFDAEAFLGSMDEEDSDQVLILFMLRMRIFFFVSELNLIPASVT